MSATLKLFQNAITLAVHWTRSFHVVVILPLILYRIQHTQHLRTEIYRVVSLDYVKSKTIHHKHMNELYHPIFVEWTWRALDTNNNSNSKSCTIKHPVQNQWVSFLKLLIKKETHRVLNEGDNEFASDQIWIIKRASNEKVNIKIE